MVFSNKYQTLKHWDWQVGFSINDKNHHGVVLCGAQEAEFELDFEVQPVFLNLL